MSVPELLAALSWRDLLDFVLLYAASYAALRLLEGTRAVPVLVFVAVLAAAGWAARELDIVGFGLLLEAVLEYIIIILIVVFHPELRRLLVRVGQRLMPAARRESTASAVDALVSACGRLQQAKIGALIILEGELDVLEVSSDAGVEIDAPLQAETLVALMVPHAINTAHDGAVLIRELRIARAGVVLPLSKREGLDHCFGTRHRGALGISEDSDALVIVLSEERGELRVVEGGAMSEALEREQLQARVEAWLERPLGEDEARAEGSGVSAAVSSSMSAVMQSSPGHRRSSKPNREAESGR
ncbi:hypothetical protein PPSIR1_10140 [Plesiocystis pacifica SIR-1]|uniref:Diadenylate cyclase n=1 Tax=Plesiocystis pacifica SIR-1 TaxID=391625 RepID=A6GKI2_9BACT|nr:diadenylate cyclase [Plesiocystis pacifica]EDM73621.1 hypothetical protein PPSIR1_10140 [Plesiocystis pacifica SIR-1]